MATGKDFGLYVPTTNVWDTSQIQQLEVESVQLKELLIRLYQNLNRISIALNIKESGYYYPQEFVTGSEWFPNPSVPAAQQRVIGRPERRTVIDFGSLPNTASKSVAHNITCTDSTRFVHIYGTASKMNVSFAYIPIPYVDVNTAANNIQIDVDDTNVIITTAADYSEYTAYIVLEYLQN